MQGLLPRGEKSNKLREKHAAINKTLEDQLQDLPNATFVGIEPATFYRTGTEEITRNDMYDFLHLTATGFQKMCDPLLEEIQSLLQTFVKVENTSMETSSIAGELASDQP
jgi:platelet-activating factor acetylhydrolase IB subunit beta/gamma